MHLSDNATLRALVWMIACGVLFGILNMLQKLLTHQLHPPQVMCLRYLVGSSLLLPFVKCEKLLHHSGVCRPAGGTTGRAAPRCMPGAASFTSRAH